MITNKIKTTILVTSILLFIGCSSQPTVEKKIVSSDPRWLNDPYVDNDDVAAIGCARAHYNGVPGQKKLAVANAIDEIASQVNTTVENVSLRRKNHNDGRLASSSLDTTSLHSVEKINIATKIKAYYTKNNGDICAWVVQK